MIYRNKFINVHIIWFYEDEAKNSSADMIYCRQVKHRVGGAKEFYTLLIDLNKSEEEIFSEFSKTNKREIRKSIKNDNLNYQMYHENIDDSLLNNFFDAHNRFTKERNLGDISPLQFKGYRENNQLYISTISTDDNEIIWWRVYVANGNRVRSLVSNSFFHNEEQEKKRLIARTGRAMKWKDILYFKENNYKIFDFGGWYNGKEDKKKLAINQYKESFCKHTELSYNYIKCKTFKCYIFRFLASIKDTLKHFT
ncbi:MAG: hypothetical protein DRG78_21780 [Epsilonproteobacteria bacterium]|nr:MAG: hypothetical protein DRG78_21780 [Campylobacterota bacterium]